MDIDLLPKNDGELIQNVLKEITGQSTVPSVFIGHIFIGGNQELQAIVNDGRFGATMDAAIESRAEKQRKRQEANQDYIDDEEERQNDEL